MQQLSISSKWSNKALPLRGRYLAAAWDAYMILKNGFCEIMLIFVHTGHENDVPPVTVLFKSGCIKFYHSYITSADTCIMPAMCPDYIVL